MFFSILFFRSVFKNCEGCDAIFYCGNNCEKEDRKIHKFECKIFEDHYETLNDTTERFLIRLYLTLKHFPEKRTQKHKIPRTDPKAEYRSYDDFRTQREEIEKDKTKMECFENILKKFLEIGLEWDREELFECFCKIMSNTFAINNRDRITIGGGIFIRESIFENSSDPNADLIFDGNNLEVRAIKNISSTEEVTVRRGDLQFLLEKKKTLQELLKMIKK